MSFLPGHEATVQAIDLFESVLTKVLAGSPGASAGLAINQQGLVFVFFEFTDALFHGTGGYLYRSADFASGSFGRFTHIQH